MQLATWGQVLPMVIAVAVALYVPGLAIVWAAKSATVHRCIVQLFTSIVTHRQVASTSTQRGALRHPALRHPALRHPALRHPALRHPAPVLEYCALAPLLSIVIAGASGVLAYPAHIHWGWSVYCIACLIVFAVVSVGRICAIVFSYYWSSHGNQQSHVDKNASYYVSDHLPAQVATDALDPHIDTKATEIADNAAFEPAFKRHIRTVRALAAVSCVSLIVAAISVIIRLIHASPSPDQVTQNYDTVFHDNVVANTVLTGQASSLHALTPIREVYPIAFHEFAALATTLPHMLRSVGIPVPMDWSYTVPAAMNATWLVFAAAVWSISILYLVRVVVGNTMLGNAIAPILAVSVAGGPFLLLNWGTLYPMFAGQAILPVLVALTWKWCVGSRETCIGGESLQMHCGDSAQPLWCRPRMVWTGLLWIIVAMSAVSFAHFRVNMTFLLVAVPLAVIWLKDFALFLRERYGRAAFHTVIWAFIGAVVLVCGVVIAYFAKRFIIHQGRPISDHLNGPPALPTDSMPVAIMRAITGSTLDAANHYLGIDWLLVFLLVAAIAAICGVLVKHVGGAHDCVVAQRAGIMLVAFVLLCFVIVACSGTHADWAKVVTALWYKDQRRLYGAWGMVTIPIICAGIVIAQSAWKQWIQRKRVMQWAWQSSRSHIEQRGEVLCDTPNTTKVYSSKALGKSLRKSASSMLLQYCPSVLAVLLTCCICVASPVMRGIETATAETFRFADNGQDVPMLSSDEYLLLKRISQHVPANDMVISDPWNGSGLMLAIGDRRPFYAHLFMAWDDDHRYIGEHLKDMAHDPQVCAVLQRNNLHWYVQMGGPFSDPMQEQHRVFLGLKTVPEGMQLIDSQGDAKLYKITGCQ